MLRIGITGGIACGKTTVCNILEQKGYAVYISDDAANNLIETNQELRNELIQAFGDDTFIDGVYNRKYISSMVFTNSSSLNKLNKIFESYMEADLKSFEAELNTDMYFYESALIFEHGKEKSFDKIICVFADDDTCIQRLMRRNNFTKNECDMRIHSQYPIRYKYEHSDFCIDTTEEISPQIDKMLLKLWRLTK